MTKFEPRSFLLVLFAFIGNAQVMGLDLTLTFIAPLLLLAQLRDRWTINQRMLPALFVIMTLLSFAALRAPIIGIPYSDTYYLWPLKALILVLLVSFGREATWPVGNMLALALLVIALILVGTVKDGRLASVFGPNMLYRIFGLLLAFALLQSFKQRVGVKLILALLAGVGFYALLLTGSRGALVVIAFATAAVFLRISKTIFVVLTAVLVVTATAAVQFSAPASLAANLPVALNRMIYKLSVQETSERMLSWIEIISHPFSAFGNNYSDLWMIWSYRNPYPHNIFLELYGFFGLVGIGIILVILVAFFKALPRILEGDVIAISFAIFTIGSLVSGDLSDNFGVIGLAGGLALRPSIQRSNDKQTQKVFGEKRL